MKVNKNIFRKYDIRGIVDEDLTDNFVEALGRSFGTFLTKKGLKSVFVGGDCRLSTERFRTVITSGLIKSGCDVTSLGVCTTPMLYFALNTKKADAGVMITGSHNPTNYNGFKLCVGTKTIYGSDIQDLYQIINADMFIDGCGKSEALDVSGDYENYMVESFDFKKKLKVVIDAGNGTAGEFILPMLKRLNVDVVDLNCKMDGTFPAHHPDPTVEENLEQMKECVIKNSCDLGIAFDGDGDRLGVVDEKGQVVWGDSLMIMYAREILSRKPGETFIGDVKCSRIMYDSIEELGGKTLMWKTGHSLIKAKMKETGAALAGEMSGHMFFADRFFGFDDGIYAALRIIEIAAAADVKFSEILGNLPETFATPEIRVQCDDDIKFELVERIKGLLKERYEINDIDGVRFNFAGGWGLIRASNTQDVLVMRFEADCENTLNEMQKFVENEISLIKEQL